MDIVRHGFIDEENSREHVAKVTYNNTGISLEWMPSFVNLKAGDLLYVQSIPERQSLKTEVISQDLINECYYTCWHREMVERAIYSLFHGITEQDTLEIMNEYKKYDCSMAITETLFKFSQSDKFSALIEKLNARKVQK
jgi:hypothetical protein